MKIALTSRLSPELRGGIEAVVRELAVHLKDQRPTWQIDAVWAFDRKTFLSSFPLLCDIVGGVLIAVRSRRADVVLINGAEYAWPLALGAIASRRVIVVWHGTRAFEVPALVPHMSLPVQIYWKLETWLQRLALRFDRHIAVAPSVVEELRVAYGFSKHVTVIVNGANQAASANVIGEASRTVVWVGTNAHKKGLDIALRAFSLARERIPGLRLRIVGLHASGDDQEQPGITYLGALSPAQVRAEYAAAAAMLATTRYEACSMAVIEALASGIPVIASPVVAWMIGPAGFAAKTFEPADFASALVRLFSEGTDRQGLSAHAVARAKVFDWETAARAYCEEIERCA